MTRPSLREGKHAFGRELRPEVGDLGLSRVGQVCAISRRGAGAPSPGDMWDWEEAGEWASHALKGLREEELADLGRLNQVCRLGSGAN